MMAVSVVGLMSESYQNSLARATLKGLLRLPAWRNAMRLVQYRSHPATTVRPPAACGHTARCR
jgi:hypothetical protein